MTDRPEHTCRIDSLIEQWLDEDLGPAESAELEAALLESPTARDRFWEKATFESLVHEAVGLTGPLVADSEADRPMAKGGVKRIAAVVLAGICLLAVGGGLGSLVTTQALADLAKSMAARFTVVEEGFESGPAPGAKYIPLSPDTWSGDATAVVGAERGVVPLAGERMLRLLDPHAVDGNEPAEYASEIWRVIPIEAVREGAEKAAQSGGLVTGQLQIDLGAAFNQSEAASTGDERPAERAKMAGVGIFAFKGDVSDIRGLWKDRVAKALASSQAEQILDLNPHGWQRVNATLPVPPETRFLLVHCYVRDSQRRPGAAFDGQFMDDIRVSAFPVPKRGGGDL